MRRADRLFRLIQLLRPGRVTTAQVLARQLAVSERTVYRDIRDLSLSGVPIIGEAGVGYTVREGFSLPPLMFSADEVAALVLGARMVKSWGDPVLAGDAERVLNKVAAVLPSDLKERLAAAPLFAPPFSGIDAQVANTLTLLRGAVDGKHKVRFGYTREDGKNTTRTVWPLGLFFWGRVWTLGAWCERRAALRNFRLDRMDGATLTGESYRETPGRTLGDLFRQEGETLP
jgi:predicted DNA-binding transcriptional regulator YafY